MFDLINLIFAQVDWNDIFDIILVTLLIYKALTIMSSTKMTKVVLGLISLFILFLLSITFHFESLNWLLSNFFDSIFIIILVLFQDQIRNGLASFFKTSGSLGGIKKNRFHHDIEEVIEAIRLLKEKGDGAIIFFENAQSLSNYTVNGTQLGTRINANILVALACNDSPLHDGAIAVGKGKILAAGIFLPLSRTVESIRHFGSRHRAALGLAEVTDAVIITLSEETHEIRLFHNARCILCKNIQDLRTQILKFWIKGNRSSKKEVALE